MFSRINVDACKTSGCKNLGVLNSPDYSVQGKYVLCRACGFLFPLISERSLNLFRQSANQLWSGLIKVCPGCGGATLKKYGFSAQERRSIVSSAIKLLFLPLGIKPILARKRSPGLFKKDTRWQIFVPR